MFIIVPKSSLSVLIPYPRLIAYCIQLVVVNIIPDPRSLIALDSVPVPVSLRSGSDGLEEFISFVRSGPGPDGARARGGRGGAEDVRHYVRGGGDVAWQGELEHVVEDILIEKPLRNGKKKGVSIRKVVIFRREGVGRR